MNKIFALFFSVLIVLTLAACSTNGTANESNIDTTEIGNQLATSVYLSQGLLEAETSFASKQFVFLSSDVSEIESRMDQIMMYFEQVDILIASSPETALDITLTESTLDGYESQVVYTVEDTTYTVHYNIVDSLENDDLDETEFELVGVLEYGNVSLDINGGTEVEDGEVEMFFETYETESDDYVRVEIENDEFEQYFEIETSKDGNEMYSELRLEKDGVDGAIEIYIEEGGLDSYYEITKEVDGEFTIYYFEYSIGDISGSMQLTEYVVEGEMVQHYIIEEDGYYNEYTIPENATSPDDL